MDDLRGMHYVRIILLCLFMPVPVMAQLLQLRTGDVRPQRASTEEKDVLRTKGERGAKAYRYLVFDHTLNTAERRTLETHGVEFLTPLREHAWGVSVPLDLPAEVLFRHGLTGVHVPAAAEKFDPRLHRAPGESAWEKAMHEVVISPWPGAGSAALMALRELRHATVRPLGHQGAFIVRLRGRDIDRVAAHPDVCWVEPAPEPGEPEDVRGRTFHRVSPIAPGIQGSPGLDGSGVTVVVNDDGFVGPHIDFKGRNEQSAVAGDLTGDHGDMVAGIVAGAGNLDPRYPGMAPGADLIIRQYDSDMPNTVQLHQNNGAMIFSTSYSNGCNAGYTAVTRMIDEETVDNPALVQVFSAGNNGNGDCGFGAGLLWGNITGGHKIAKNAIATANLSDVDLLTPSSSRGPSADGRLKPDISAYGNSQMSTDPNNTYAPGGGTSAAAPGVSGTLAVLYQGWRELHGSDPASGLMKAFLLNTAEDLGNTGPDYTFGWGRLNGAEAWRTMSSGQFLSGTVEQGDSATHTIEVPANTAKVRVMLYWMDPAAALQAPAALVNDLDLTGTDPAQALHLPWHLENIPDANALAAPATRAPDHANNVEQVEVDAPLDGTWTFTVVGSDVPMGPQDYFVVYTFLETAPRITYPLAGEVLTAGESHRFRFDSGNNVDPITISMSLDSGITWNSYTPVPGDQRYFDIGIGDTLIEQVFIRVSQNGFVDQQGPCPILRQADDLEVLFNCPDSAGLAWPSMPGISAYIVHRLGDRYMDSVATTTDTSYVFTGLDPVHDDWFAVTAVTDLGSRARRSIAIARPQQLVNCTVTVDMRMEAVERPGDLVIQCQPDPAMEVLVRNAGANAVQDITVGYQVNGNAVVTEDFTLTIASGDSALITLQQQDLGFVQGDNTLRVWCTTLNDQYPLNDTLVMNVFAEGTVANLPFMEDVEDLDICGPGNQCDLVCDAAGSMINAANGLFDDIDWRVDTNGTSTQGTGPTFDHTRNDAQGRYYYLEGSGNCTGKTGLLTSPCLPLNGDPDQFMTFWYHMYGSGMGELHLDIMVEGSWQLDVIPPIVGDQGDQWLQAVVDLSPYAGNTINLRFRGITGTSHLSDIALDDISVNVVTGLQELASNGELLLVPTGTPGLYTIKGKLGSDAWLEVFDAMGRLIDRPDPRQGRAEVDLRSQGAGLYLVRAMDGGVLRSGRVVRP